MSTLGANILKMLVCVKVSFLVHKLHSDMNIGLGIFLRFKNSNKVQFGGGKLLVCFGFGSVSILFRLGLSVECFLQHIKETAHEDSTEQILKGHKGIRDAEQHRGQLKVDEKDDDPEVDERVGRRDEVSLLVDHKHEG